MPVFTDQTSREVIVPHEPHRIVSLVPSQTELLADLGLGDRVAAITRFCVHPEEWFRNKPRIGGTKQLKIEQIHALEPDLILANKEENVKEQVEELADRYPTWISDVCTLADACQMIRDIGKMTGTIEKAGTMAAEIELRFAKIEQPAKRPRTAYLIWQKPYMSIGAGTFIHSMMEMAGLQNIFADRLRYPEITLPELRQLDCQLLLLSSEPFPFREKHAEELRPLLPGTEIRLVDGEMFSWYGSRLLKAPAYFRELRVMS